MATQENLYLVFYTSTTFSDYLSFKQAKWKKLSIFWNMNIIINTVLCNRFCFL